MYTHSAHVCASPRRQVLTRTIGLTLAIAVGTARGEPWATPHSVSAGKYTLRASTIYSLAIPEQVANANGIARDARHGVLNVLVSKTEGNSNSNTRAEVHVVARKLTGQRRDIPMREIVSNGSVTYLGSYDFVRGEVLDFVIDAIPLGSRRKLRLTFRDRLWPAAPSRSPH